MYREAARIEATVAALATSSLASPKDQLIFVDDGSDDQTADTVLAALDRFALPAQVVRLEHNMGKGAAVRAGILEAKGRFVAFVDADLSAGVTEIERCFRFIEAGGCEVVASTRGAPSSKILKSQPPLRQVSGQLFNVLLRSLGLTRLADT
ncbi:MAG: glycosyltransferase, partial [Thermoleophilaceae bacterium]|nr:glycosyltransferase [Thermoleophilaceae bacterium]